MAWPVNSRSCFSDFFTICLPSSCSLELAGTGGERFTIDAATQGTELGDGITSLYLFDAGLQALRPFNADSLATARSTLPTGSPEVGATAGKDGSAAASPGSALTADASAAAPPDSAGGGMSLGWIIGGAAAGAGVLGLALSGGGGDTAVGNEAGAPEVTRLLAEGNDLTIDAGEVTTDNGLIIYGSAVNATQVEISINLPGSSVVNTRVFDVNANGDFGFVFGAGFFSGAPGGVITISATPVSSSGARGATASSTLTFTGGVSADPSDTASTSVLSQADLLDQESGLFVDDGPVTTAQADHEPVTHESATHLPISVASPVDGLMTQPGFEI